MPVKVYAEAGIKDGLRHAMGGQHAAIKAFLEAKLTEGFTLEEINELSAIQMQVMPTLIERNGRQKVDWPFKLIGPDDYATKKYIWVYNPLVPVFYPDNHSLSGNCQQA